MKTLVDGELMQALRNAPEPVRDFATSKTLAGIYDGLQKKHKLSDLEMVSISEIANRTLLNIEPESAIETNIHQTLPELSHATTTELAADITARILKEGKRRQEENIREASPYVEAIEPRPARDPEYERLDNMDEDSPEWQAIEKKEREEAEAEHEAFEEKYAQEQAAARPPAPEEEADDEAFLDDEGDVKSRYELEDAEIEKEFDENQAALNAAPAPSTEVIKATVGLNPTAVSRESQEILSAETLAPIATKKLAAPSAVKREEARAEIPAPTVPETSLAAKLPAPPPAPKSADPYRESLD